ncbi:flagellar hook-length control protein FliK [Massilia sp. SR12]
MNTQTVQTNPLLSGNPASPRAGAATTAQEDGQFQQALTRQIERQAAALPPTPAPAAPAARRAEAAKPASAPQPHKQQPPQAQPARPAQPSAAQATQAAKPAQPAQTATAASQAATASPAAAPATAGGAAAQQAQGGSASEAGSGAPAADAAAADEANAVDAAQQPASDPLADMLMLMASLNQPATPPAAVAEESAGIAATSATLDETRRYPHLIEILPLAKWPGMAAGAEPPTDMAPEYAAESLRAIIGNVSKEGVFGPVIDNDAMARTLAGLEARIAHQATSAQAGAASASAMVADGADLAADALQPNAGLAAQGADVAPQADFQATLAQAKADAGKAGEAAARDAAQTILPASTAQATTAQAPAGAANAQAAQAVASNQLHARVGSQGWDQQLGQKVVWMVNGGEQSATLTLNPPDLGPLQVVLSVSNDQTSVAFMAAQPEVREALEQALPKLRESMGEAGIALGDTSVSAGSQEQKEAFAQMTANSRSRGASNGQNDNPDPGAGPEQQAHQARRSVLGAVDTFA